MKKSLIGLLAVVSLFTIVTSANAATSTQNGNNETNNISTKQIQPESSKYISDYPVYLMKYKYPTISDVPREYFYNQNGYVGTLDCSSDDIVDYSSTQWKAYYSGWVYNYGGVVQE